MKEAHIISDPTVITLAKRLDHIDRKSVTVERRLKETKGKPFEITFVNVEGEVGRVIGGPRLGYGLYLARRGAIKELEDFSTEGGEVAHEVLDTNKRNRGE